MKNSRYTLAQMAMKILPFFREIEMDSGTTSESQTKSYAPKKEMYPYIYKKLYYIVTKSSFGQLTYI
jgi:hypothetical protein